MKVFHRRIAILGLDAWLPPVAAHDQQDCPSEQLAAYNKPDRERSYYAGAKSEGKITWYTSRSPATRTNELAAAFRKPNIPASASESYRATRARDERADYGGIPGAALHRRYDRNHYSTLEAVKRQQHAGAATIFRRKEISRATSKKKVPKVLSSGPSTANRTSVLAYNKNSIPAKLAPKNYQGLLRPELKDKIAFCRQRHRRHRHRCDAQVSRRRNTSRNSGAKIPRFTMSRGALCSTWSSSGEVGVSPTTFRNHVEVSLKVGAPIEWIPMDVVPSNSGFYRDFGQSAAPACGALARRFHPRRRRPKGS